MFENLKNKLTAYANEYKKRQKSVGLQFNDPIAQNTDWTPLRGGGANFKTQFLSLTPKNQFKVKKSKGGIMFNLIFAIVGLGVMLFGLNQYFSSTIANSENEVKDLLFLLVFGLIFLAVGAIPLFNKSKLLIFDKDAGYCWTGNKQPRDIIRAEDKAKLIKLERIKGIQILKEYISSSGNSSSYYSYEINLILDGNERINVMDHGRLGAIREDANLLSEYLGVPVFDGV